MVKVFEMLVHVYNANEVVAEQKGQELCEQLLELTFVSLVEKYSQSQIHFRTICTPHHMLSCV